jgi:two-component system, OmpR family, sensor histidine kinase KdpD
MREVIEIVMPQLRMLTANHDLIVDVPQNLPEIMVDQHRIAQVITNLVNNAVKHSPAQSEIHIEAQQRDHELEVRVSDQGMGIPSSERDKVFEAFYQHVEEGKQRAGAGLGLAICKGIIEQHQGRIWVDNSHSNGLNTNGTGPKGATVIFTLPIVDA